MKTANDDRPEILTCITRRGTHVHGTRDKSRTLCGHPVERADVSSYATFDPDDILACSRCASYTGRIMWRADAQEKP